MRIIGSRLLNSAEKAEVDEWLRQHNLDIGRLRRDFSDVYPLAVLFQPVFPRLINMINYPKRNRISLKKENWETFNFKVLTKLNLSLGKAILEQLAKGSPGAIEVLISELLRAEKRRRLGKEKEATSGGGAATTGGEEEAPEEDKGVDTVMVNRQEGDNVVQVPSKMISYSRYERISRECQAKEAIIEMYQTRLSHLEEMVQAKANRMDEIWTIIDNLPPAVGLSQRAPEVPPEIQSGEQNDNQPKSI